MSENLNGIGGRPNRRSFLKAGLGAAGAASVSYIRLHREFVYLAMILDACSRKVVVGNWTGHWPHAW